MSKHKYINADSCSGWFLVYIQYNSVILWNFKIFQHARCRHRFSLATHYVIMTMGAITALILFIERKRVVMTCGYDLWFYEHDDQIFLSTWIAG